MTTLRDELRNNPACADAIAVRDLAEIARIGSIGRVRARLVEIADVQATLHRTGEWWAIKELALADTHPAQQAAIAVRDVAEARYKNIDLQAPLVGQSFAGLVAAGALTQSTLDEILALGFEPDPLTPPQVEAALYNRDATEK